MNFFIKFEKRNKESMEPMKKKYPPVKFLIFFIGFASLLGTNIFTIYTSRKIPSNSQKEMQINENGYKNPYSDMLSNPSEWKKVAMHIHSNEVWYTPERESLDDILNYYREYDYHWLSISDYNRITTLDKQEKYVFTSYEHGNNLNKRHLLVVGSNKVIQDPFFFGSGEENYQWMIDQFNGENPFLIINHPTLNNAFPTHLLENIHGYHSVEFFSPFEENTKLWDELLQKGIPVWGMASDDMHYLPKTIKGKPRSEPWYRIFWKWISMVYDRDGESFRRFIKIDASESNEEFFDALCSGRFTIHKKFHQDFDDVKITKLMFNENDLVFQLELEKPAKQIKIFTGQNEPIVFSDTNHIEYKINSKDLYIRAEILDLSGIVATNPIYKKNKFRAFPKCTPKY